MINSNKTLYSARTSWCGMQKTVKTKCKPQQYTIMNFWNHFLYVKWSKSLRQTAAAAAASHTALRIIFGNQMNTANITRMKSKRQAKFIFALLNIYVLMSFSLNLFIRIESFICVWVFVSFSFCSLDSIDFDVAILNI